jgi:hypothetical protein
MSLADLYAKKRHTDQLMMQSPLNSRERNVWIQIKREWEELIRKMTTGATVAIEQNFEIIPWD